MKKIAFIIFLLMSLAVEAQIKTNNSGSTEKIIVEMTLDPEKYQNLISREYMIRKPKGDTIFIDTDNLFLMDTHSRKQTRHRLKIIDNSARLVVNSKDRILVYLPFGGTKTVFLNPGDSVRIIDTGHGVQIYGNATESIKFQLELNDLLDRMVNDRAKDESLPPFDFSIASKVDYMKASTYKSKMEEKTDSAIESHRGKIDSKFLDFLKIIKIYDFEQGRITLARGFVWYNLTKHGSEKANEVAGILDALKNGNWARWLQDQRDFLPPSDPEAFYDLTALYVWRKENFDNDFSPANLNTQAKRLLAYYQYVKENFVGLFRERLLQYLVAERLLYKLGYKHPLVETILKDYYAQSEFPEFKAWMKDYEKAAAIKNKQTMPSFKDLLAIYKIDMPTITSNKKFSIIDISKFACKDCAAGQNAFEDAAVKLTSDPFINVIRLDSQVRNLKWQKLSNWISEKKLLLPLLVDPEGAIISYPMGELLATISKLRNELNDGPYVFYTFDNSDAFVQSISYNDGLTTKNFKPKVVTVGTDIPNQTFVVKLKRALITEPSEYPKPENQLVLSDIEGNFDSFRKLLQAHKVVDSNYNWTFGKGHLVLVGDMMDRGNQVTECLWLIYSLEDKAKAAGGYVHYILGNHEIMNISGSVKYVQDKYIASINLMKIDYDVLYGEHSELGRWLRTKNIVEKIGNVMYTHGGFAREFQSINLPLSQINSIVRPYFVDMYNQKYNEPTVSNLFSSRTSPFWYRGYYDSKNLAPVIQIDSILQKFDVRHIVTGHTIIADTVSMHYSGKVFNTDVPHAKDKSEALLIEGDKYYRVNSEGHRVLLFTDDRKNIR